MIKKNMMISMLHAILLGVISVGFSAQANDEIEIQVADVEDEDLYVGYYEADEGSYVNIVKENNQYAIDINIVRLTSIDDGVSEYVAGNQMLFSATDASGNPIGGLMKWNDDYKKINLMITDSTWGYLPNGTEINFSKESNTNSMVDVNGFSEKWYTVYQYFQNPDSGEVIEMVSYEDGNNEGLFSTNVLGFNTGSYFDHTYTKEADGAYVYKAAVGDMFLKYYPQTGNCIAVEEAGETTWYYPMSNTPVIYDYEWYREYTSFQSASSSELEITCQNDVMLEARVIIGSEYWSFNVSVEPDDKGNEGELIYCDTEMGVTLTYYPRDHHIYIDTSDGLFEGDYKYLSEKTGENMDDIRYLIEGSDSRYLTYEDIQSLDIREINYAKNEIYARHGRKFNSYELQEYFNSQAWYIGKIEPTDFQVDVLNEYEMANVSFLSEVELSIDPNGYQLDQNSTEEGDVTFTEDWYLKYYYYIDSNGDYFILKHSDSIFQIDIADEGVFNADFSKYGVEYDEEYGNIYVYYDQDSYELIKYYPGLNHTIKIVTENGEIICTNISEEEYLEAERNYAESQLEGFTEDWYKVNYISRYGKTYDSSCQQIEYVSLSDSTDIIILEANALGNAFSGTTTANIEFLSDQYIIDYENYAYVYETTCSGITVYLGYFPAEKLIKIYDEYEAIGGYFSGRYYLVAKEVVTSDGNDHSESEEIDQPQPLER